MNAVEAGGSGLLAWYLADSAGGDLTSWRGVLALVAGLYALACLWDTRPPGRVAAERERSRGGGGGLDLSPALWDGPAG